MIMVRAVLNCQPGKVGELVKKFKALGEAMQERGLAPFRIFTDVAGGSFWTLVLEREYESLAEYDAVEKEIITGERFKAIMAGYHDIVKEGRREIYRVEA